VQFSPDAGPIACNFSVDTLVTAHCLIRRMWGAGSVSALTMMDGLNDRGRPEGFEGLSDSALDDTAVATMSYRGNLSMTWGWTEGSTRIAPCHASVLRVARGEAACSWVDRTYRFLVRGFCTKGLHEDMFGLDAPSGSCRVVSKILPNTGALLCGRIYVTERRALQKTLRIA
jgi:hypothetical protein